MSPKMHSGLVGVGRDADLGVVVVRPHPAGQPDGRPVPVPAGRNRHGPRFGEIGGPPVYLNSGLRGIYLGVCPPARDPQREASQLRGDELPRRKMKRTGFGDELHAARKLADCAGRLPRKGGGLGDFSLCWAAGMPSACTNSTTSAGPPLRTMEGCMVSVATLAFARALSTSTRSSLLSFRAKKCWLTSMSSSSPMAPRVLPRVARVFLAARARPRRCRDLEDKAFAGLVPGHHALRMSPRRIEAVNRLSVELVFPQHVVVAGVVVDLREGGPERVVVSRAETAFALNQRGVLARREHVLLAVAALVFLHDAAEDPGRALRRGGSVIRTTRLQIY